MSEWAEWVETFQGFMELIFKQMLKVSAFSLKKQKSFIHLKNIFQAMVSKYAKIDPKDCALEL